MISTLNYLLQRLWLKLTLRSENEVFTRKIHGFKFTCTNKWAYLSALKEIYMDECYAISPGIKIESILDIGANLGFSVAYFKEKFPSAKITAFEADKNIFQTLKENVEGNRLKDVELINAAAWVRSGSISFHQDHSQGGSITQSELHSSTIEVPTVDLKEFLQGRRYDLLKLDVEGAEKNIIPHIAHSLRDFKLIFVEYHESKGETGHLSETLRCLEDNGFKYSFSPIFGSQNIFREYRYNKAFDLQLNIYAVRKDLLGDV